MGSEMCIRDRRFISTWNRTSLIKRIAIGVVVGAVLGLEKQKLTEGKDLILERQSQRTR